MRPQHIYKATNFIFDKGGPPKPKYFVVLHQDADTTLLFSLTTSQPKLPASLDDESSCGCVHFNDDRGYGHAFVWKKEQSIGVNGFSFPKRTYVQWESRPHLYTLTEDQTNAKATKEIIECCCLTDEAFAQVLECVLHSRYLGKRQKREIENTLAVLNNKVAVQK